MTSDIDRLLARAMRKKQEQVQDVIPKEIKIAKNARLKSSPTLGKIVAEEGGSPYEWYSLMVARKNDPEYIVRDIVLPANQDVSGGHVQVNGAEILKVNERLRSSTDLYVVGWMHNHAEFSTFHSGTDKANMELVLNSVSLNTEKSVHKNFELFLSKPEFKLEHGRLSVAGKELEDVVLEYSLKHPEKIEEMLQRFGIQLNGRLAPEVALELLKELLSASELETKEPRIAGFAFSIVVNNEDSTPYTEIAVIEEDMLTKKKRTYNKERVPLTVVEVPDDITIDMNALRKEVKANINLPERPSFLEGIKERFGFGSRKSRRRSRLRSSFAESGAGRQSKVYQRTSYSTKGYSYSPVDDDFDEGPDSVNLKELCRLAAKEFMDYLENYTSEDVLHSKYFAGVIEGLLQSSDVRKAFASAGELTLDEIVEKPDILDEDELEAGIYLSLYYKLKKEPDKHAIDFLQDCVAENGLDIDEAIKKHAQILSSPDTPKEAADQKEFKIRDVNPAAAEFYKSLTKYLDCQRDDIGYNSWLAKAVKHYAEKPDITLMEALSSCNWPSVNKHVGSEYLLHHEEKKVAGKLKREKDTLATEFMREFAAAPNTARGKGEVLEEYVTMLAIANAKSDEQHLEIVLKRAAGKQSQNTATTAAAAAASAITAAASVSERHTAFAHSLAQSLVQSLAQSLVLYASMKKDEHMFFYGKWMADALQNYLASEKPLEEHLNTAGELLNNYRFQKQVKPVGIESVKALEERLAKEEVSDGVSDGYKRFANDFTAAMDLYIADKPATPTAVLRRYVRSLHSQKAQETGDGAAGQEQKTVADAAGEGQHNIITASEVADGKNA